MARQILTPDAFFKIAERKKQDVPYPEAGNGAVLPIWGQTPTERTRFEKQMQVDAETRNVPFDDIRVEFRERLFQDCCRHDGGGHVFTREQVKQLGECNAALVERAFNVAMELSGYSETDGETLVKNSEPTTTNN